jgi:hypothetical protein
MIIQYKVREFVFTAAEVGNIGELLVKARRAMRTICSGNDGPFVASISKSAKITMRNLETGQAQ